MSRFTGPLHLEVPPNPARKGRDFVVGDLHGQYTFLLREMLRVRFNTKTDRLFSVGDLIDRGPESLECLRLLRQPWFHAVLGNHEAMLLTYLRNRHSDAHCAKDFLHNGGRWVDELDPADHAELSALAHLLENLPLVLKVNNEHGNFNVAHAQLMSGLRAKTAEDLKGDVFSNEQAQDKAMLDEHEASILWSRRLLATARNAGSRASVFAGESGKILVSDQAVAPHLRLTYVGHSPLVSPFLHRSHLHVDTGAKDLPHDGRVLLLDHAEVMAALSRAGVLFPAS